MNRLTHWAWHTILTTAPHETIGPDDRPYMFRWFVIPKNRWCGVYLHWFQRSDDDSALHDHPWPSLSVTLSGHVTEVYAPRGANASDTAQHLTRYINTGTITLRRADFAHRIVLGAFEQAITLFFVGWKVRDWGFWCPKGWRHWREFCSKGCD